jgi:hypothetical protein
MVEVTIKYPDESWGQFSGTGDSYKPIEYKAQLINVIRLDGAWIGIIMDDTDQLTRIEMSKVVEWEGHDSDYRPSW